MTAVQLDLFGPDAETRRLAGGLVCLRDVVPEAMDVLIHLAHWRRVEDRGIGTSGDWAYSIRRDGLYCEHRLDWSGSRTRMRCITWAELTEQLTGDPRRARILAWSQSLAEPSWKELLRPYEFWPDSGSWHPSYIAGDRGRPGWDQRLAAWRALQAILTDAITRLDPTF